MGPAFCALISRQFTTGIAACDRFIQPVLYFKGFHAIQTHRLAHWLWNHGRVDFALYLQSRSSEIFQTDIHPGRQGRQGAVPRSRDRACGRHDGDDRRQCLDPAGCDAWRHGQGVGRPASEDRRWRAHRRRGQGAWQYRDRALQPCGVGFRGAQGRCRPTPPLPAFRPASSGPPVARSLPAPWTRCSTATAESLRHFAVRRLFREIGQAGLI
jgi:hypothetical protein